MYSTNVFLATYTQLEGDFRCTGTRSLYVGNPGSADECRTRCDDDSSCKYYARWNIGHCETYSECPSTAPDGRFKINRFEKSNLPNGKRDNYSRMFQQKAFVSALRKALPKD